MQPELPCWNPRNAFETDDRWSFYTDELRQTLRFLANHPSFVMLTFGNELCANAPGHLRMREMLKMAREIDGTRRYANASNPHYGNLGCDPDSDFYTSQSFESLPLRGSFAGMHGRICEAYPSEDWDYTEGMKRLRATYDGPVVSFEVGQYEILPDLNEISQFQGVTRADNLLAVRHRAAHAGQLEDWDRRVRATAALSRLCYRAEVEANLKNGTLHVFDVSTFTVSSEQATCEVTTDASGHLTSCKVNMSYMDWSTMTPIYEGETIECIKDGYFDESTVRSAPYFSVRIDGIIEK